MLHLERKRAQLYPSKSFPYTSSLEREGWCAHTLYQGHHGCQPGGGCGMAHPHDAHAPPHTPFVGVWYAARSGQRGKKGTFELQNVLVRTNALAHKPEPEVVIQKNNRMYRIILCSVEFSASYRVGMETVHIWKLSTFFWLNLFCNKRMS